MTTDYIKKIKPGNPFRNDNNVFLLKALFYEFAGDKQTCIYTLKDDDYEGYPSLYRLYMETADPTEYAFATKYLDGWEHWKLLSNATFFQPFVSRWREELELKYKSEALAKIISTSSSTSREALQASKYLLEKGWEKSGQTSRGRPSKDEIRREANRIAEDQSRLEEDYKRLSVVK